MELTPEKIKNILVVRKHNQIGDMLCSLPMYAALKKNFPNAKITLVLSPTNYTINFKELNPYADEVLFYTKGSLSNILGFYRKLRRKKYDIGIVPPTVRLSNTSHIINYLSGSSFRVGAKSINGNPNKASILLNVKSDFDWQNSHQIERNLDIVRQIGCSLTGDELKSIRFNFNKDDMDFAEDFIKQNFPDKKRMIIGFHAGAGENYRLWNTGNFIELAIKLYNKYQCYLFTAPGKIDAEVTDKLKNTKEFMALKPVIAENLDLGKLAAVLKSLNLYITNNTGTLHLSHFSGIRTLALFTSAQVNDWAYKSEKECYVSAENINDITVERVYETSCDMIIRFPLSRE